jgi:Rieske Fe-S protein
MQTNRERRDFLRRISSLAVGGVVLNAFAGCSTGLQSYFVEAKGETISLSLDSYPELGAIGGAVEIEFSGDPGDLVIVRSGEHAIVALSSTCTHLGCTVRKEPSFFRCPCHGSTYDLEGNVVRGPAEHPLERYLAQLNGTQITISLRSDQ